MWAGRIRGEIGAGTIKICMRPRADSSGALVASSPLCGELPADGIWSAAASLTALGQGQDGAADVLGQPRPGFDEPGQVWRQRGPERAACPAGLPPADALAAE